VTKKSTRARSYAWKSASVHAVSPSRILMSDCIFCDEILFEGEPVESMSLTLCACEEEE
jgi:hypothetical protein